VQEGRFCAVQNVLQPCLLFLCCQQGPNMTVSRCWVSRYIGELALLPPSSIIVSTLDFWGNREVCAVDADCVTAGAIQCLRHILGAKIRPFLYLSFCFSLLCWVSIH